HVLHPFLMGKAVSVHPLAVVLAVAAGGFLFGIVGALFAVPAIAVLNTVVTYIVHANGPRGGSAPPEATEADTEAGAVHERNGGQAQPKRSTDSAQERGFAY
ncbi:AI-2E family transporter, partial [Burkholderia multivorans]